MLNQGIVAVFEKLQFLINGSLKKARRMNCVSHSHHSKMQKDGWAKYIPNFAFK